jgi:hypothetical protein
MISVRESGGVVLSGAFDGGLVLKKFLDLSQTTLDHKDGYIEDAAEDQGHKPAE